MHEWMIEWMNEVVSFTIAAHLSGTMSCLQYPIDEFISENPSPATALLSYPDISRGLRCSGHCFYHNNMNSNFQLSFIRDRSIQPRVPTSPAKSHWSNFLPLFTSFRLWGDTIILVFQLETHNIKNPPKHHVLRSTIHSAAQRHDVTEHCLVHKCEHLYPTKESENHTLNLNGLILDQHTFSI